MSLGARIHARRKELGLTLRELGVKVNLTASFLCDLEKDKRRVGADNLFRLSEVLGIPCDQLMRGQPGVKSDYHAELTRLPGSLIRYATDANVPFRDAMKLYWCQRTIADHAGRPPDLEAVDWLKFHEALKEWL